MKNLKRALKYETLDIEYAELGNKQKVLDIAEKGTHNLMTGTPMDFVFETIDASDVEATFRVSRELRQVLVRHNDRLIIGVISCRVYNRVFIKRCAICQRFGHFFAQCEFKDEPKCGFCGGDHESNNCLDKSCKNCINCVRNNCEDTNHEAFSKQCPVYLDALKKFNDENSLN